MFFFFFSRSSIIILMERMDILVLNFYGLGTKRFHSIFKNRIMRFETHLTSPHQKHVYTPLAHPPYCTLFAPPPPPKKKTIYVSMVFNGTVVIPRRIKKQRFGEGGANKVHYGKCQLAYTKKVAVCKALMFFCCQCCCSFLLPLLCFYLFVFVCLFVCFVLFCFCFLACMLFSQ